MTLASPKRACTRHREVSVTQIEFDLGLTPTPAPTMAFAADVQETLVHLMATAILAVHHAGQEARDDAGQRES